MTTTVIDRKSGVSSSTAFKGPCKVASTTNVTKSGEQTINAIACVADDRVLLTGQTDGKQNGIWIVSTGNWERAADFNRNDDVVEGTSIRANRGSNAGLWVVTNTTAITFDTTSITLAKDTASLAGAVAAANNGSDFADPNATLRNLMSNGADIASAATVNLDNATGDFVDITGSTGISAVTLTAGNWQWARFAGAPLITIGASLIGNNNAQNVQIEAGDICVFRGYAAGVVRFWHFPIRPRQPLIKKGSDIASTGTLSIPDGDYFHVTGTTTITDIDFATVEDGRSAVLVFDGILTLTYNATTLILPGAASITTAAGDSCIVVQDSGDNVKVVAYTRADGTALIASAALSAATQAEMEAASSTTVYVSPGRIKYAPGVAKVLLCVGVGGGTVNILRSSNVSSVTDSGVGQFIVVHNTDFSDSLYAPFVSVDGGGSTTIIRGAMYDNQAAGQTPVKIIDEAAGTVDPVFWSFAAFGDQ